MIRSAAFLASILSVVAPRFQPRAEAASYLSELGRTHHFDPLTLVAIVEGESHWTPSIISKDGKDFGLSQIRATNFPECRVVPEIDRCLWRKHRLLDWRENLTMAAGLIKANREACKRKVGSTLAVYWLQAFQGFDSTRGTTCGHRRIGKRWVAQPVPALTRKILARRRELAAMR